MDYELKKLSLPPYTSMSVRQNPSGRTMVLDVLRQRYVTLTPEEWVRQHFINYLINHKGYPKALLANEVELKVGDKRMRCDSVLFGPDKQPRMIMEYKAPDVLITENVFNQIMSYNTILGVETLVMSNGIQHVIMHHDKAQNKWLWLPELPAWECQ